MSRVESKVSGQLELKTSCTLVHVLGRPISPSPFPYIETDRQTKSNSTFQRVCSSCVTHEDQGLRAIKPMQAVRVLQQDFIVCVRIQEELCWIGPEIKQVQSRLNLVEGPNEAAKPFWGYMLAAKSEV